MLSSVEEALDFLLSARGNLNNSMSMSLSVYKNTHAILKTRMLEIKNDCI